MFPSQVMFYLDKRDLENLINQSKNKYRPTVFPVTYVEFLKTKNIPFKLLLQKSLVKSHGLQCGFCTPGMVMTMYTLFHNIPQPTADQMERALEGNIVQLRGGVFRISICHSV